VQSVLDGISRWNDRAQTLIFNPRRLMPTYPEGQAVKDFRYNAYFGQNQIPKIDGASYKLNLSGLVDRRTPWTLQDLYQLPQESQVTRHVCVEGWSMIGKWTGVPFRTFLQRIGADLTAKYVGFECADGFYIQECITVRYGRGRHQVGGKHMKAWSVIGLLLGAAILATIPISPQVTPRGGVVLSVDQAQAILGHWRRVNRRVHRRAYRRGYYYGGYY